MPPNYPSARSVRLNFLRTILASVALVFLSALALHATPPPPDAPVFHNPQAVSGLGNYTSKIVASIVRPGKDSTNKNLDARVPISFANNGSQDVAIADLFNNSVLIKQGNAAATAFTDVTLLPYYDTLTDMAVGDINGDGYPDVVVCAAGYVQVFINTTGSNANHNLTFALPVIYGAVDHTEGDLQVNFTSVALASVTSTEISGGRQDILAGASQLRNGDTLPYGYLARFTNLGNAQGGLSATPALYKLDAGADRLAVGDLDDDGYTDIVAGDSVAGKFVVIKNVNTAGTRTIDPAISTPVTYYSGWLNNVAIGDVDADGARDVLVLYGRNTTDSNNTPVSSSTLVLFHNPGTGALSTYGGISLKTNIPSSEGVIGNVAIGDLNSDGTTAEIAVADGLNEKVTLLTINPYLMGLNHSLNTATAAVSTLTAGALARAVDIGDLSKDNGMDLLVANSENTTPGSLFINTVAGPDDGGTTTDPIPDGKGVSFGSIVGTGLEGTDFTVNVLRGKDSTGQVLEYISFGGNAVPLVNNNKDADYSVVAPASGFPVVFPDTTGPEAHLQTIKIHTISNKVSEAEKALYLNITYPAGDAIIGEVNSVSVALIDGKPLVLAAPKALSVVPTSIVPQSTAQLKAAGVKAVGRTNSIWNFGVTETFPKGAVGAKVKVQYTMVANPTESDWLDYINLTASAKGNVWTSYVQQPPVATKIYFRTVGSATGYRPVIGKPTAALAIVNGPLLQFSAGINTAYTPGYFNQSTNIVPTAAEDIITYRFAYKNAQVATGASANHVTITAKIPAHTTYLSGTVPDQSVTAKFITSKGVKYIQWSLGTLDQTTASLGTKYVEVKVQVDPATAFDKKKNPLKALGATISEDVFSLDSDETPAISGPPAALYAVLHGPIELAVSQPGNTSTVRGGDLINYSLVASNTSGAAVTGGVVRARIPANTVLANVFDHDADGNSTTAILPNPSAATNPAVVYVVLKSSKTFKPTKGTKIDPSALPEGALKFLLDGGYVAQEVEWTLPPIAAHSHVTVNYQVRVLYDVGRLDDEPATIVNDDYDFTIGTGATQISALYGHDPDPAPLTSTFDDSTPAARPQLVLYKKADGGLVLNNPNFHGNGQQFIAGFGDVTTVLPTNGVNFELTYENHGGADAHGVIIHDVIPEGLVLRGFFKQRIIGQPVPPEPSTHAEQFTFYDAAGTVIPAVDPATNASNMTKVRSLDIRLGSVQNITTLPTNTGGVITYTCQPTITSTQRITYPDKSRTGPGEIHSFGGFLENQGVSGKLQGFFITSSDLVEPKEGTPEDLVIRVQSDISWDQPQYARSYVNAVPGDIFSFDIPFSQNGDLAAYNAHLDFTVVKGVTLLNTGNNRPTYISCESGPLPVFLNSPLAMTQTGTRASVNLGGTILGHVKRAVVRVWFQMNTPFDPDLARSGGFIYPKDIAFGPVGAARSGTSQAIIINHTDALASTAAASASSATQAGTTANPTIGRPAGAPHLSLERTAPYAVAQKGQFTYVVNFANTGETAATDVTVGMQIPFFTHFGSTDNGYVNSYPSIPDVNGNQYPVFVPNAEHYKATERTDAGIIKDSGAGHDKIFWHFATLPAHSTGRVTLTVIASNGFADKAIKDNSLYISAGNAPSVVLAPNPLSTWVLGTRTFEESKSLILARFCSELGLTLDSSTRPVLAKYEDALGPNSRIKSSASLDALKVGSVSLYPTGNGQFLVTAPIISDNSAGFVGVSAGALITQDGAGVVAAGAGNAISINVAGLGTKTATQLLDSALDLLTNKQASLIAAGGGNLITQDGAGFALLSNHPGGGSSAISPALSGLVAAGAGNLITQDGAGLIAAVGALITQDGAGLIPQDGAGLITQDGAGLQVFSVGNVLSLNATSLVGQSASDLLGSGKASAK